MKKHYLFLFGIVAITSCNTSNQTQSELEGHYYFAKPLTSLMQTKELFTLHSVVHHYISSNEVEVTQYVMGQPVKTEVMKFSIDGSTYDIAGERYEIRKDTGNNFTLFVNNIPAIELKYIK